MAPGRIALTEQCWCGLPEAATWEWACSGAGLRGDILICRQDWPVRSVKATLPPETHTQNQPLPWHIVVQGRNQNSNDTTTSPGSAQGVHKQVQPLPKCRCPASPTLLNSLQSQYPSFKLQMCKGYSSLTLLHSSIRGIHRPAFETLGSPPYTDTGQKVWVLYYLCHWKKTLAGSDSFAQNYPTNAVSQACIQVQALSSRTGKQLEGLCNEIGCLLISTGFWLPAGRRQLSISTSPERGLNSSILTDPVVALQLCTYHLSSVARFF